MGQNKIPEEFKKGNVYEGPTPIKVGHGVTCAIDSNKELKCWGGQDKVDGKSRDGHFMQALKGESSVEWLRLPEGRNKNVEYLDIGSVFKNT